MIRSTFFLKGLFSLSLLISATCFAQHVSVGSGGYTNSFPGTDAAGRNTYGSPTLSDQAVLTCNSLKLGPGDSLRSHTANEFIFVKELEEAIPLYISILKQAL